MPECVVGDVFCEVAAPAHSGCWLRLRKNTTGGSGRCALAR